MAGRKLSTATFISDPIYRKLVMGAATKVPSVTSVTSPILGNDDGSPPPFTGDTGPGGIPEYFGLSMNVESTLPTTTTEPTFGVVNEYDFTNRVGEAIGQNMPYIMGSLQMGNLDPLKLGAIDAGIESLFGNVPDYITKESSPGVMSQTGGFESTKSYGLFPDGRIAEVTAEDLANPEIRSLTAAEADRFNPVGYIGADPSTPLGQIAGGFQAIAMAGIPFASNIFGKVVRTPAGQPMAIGSSFLGKMQHDEMWRADSLVKAGTPGVFTMTFGKNGFASYRATQDSIFGFDIEGGRVTRLTGDQFKRLYGASRGYDYRRVDWANSVANSGELIGPKLIGHVQGVGGFTQEGEFIDQRGTIYNNLTPTQLDIYTRTIEDPVAMAQVAGVLSAKASGSSGYRKRMLQKKATRLAELAGGAAQREYQAGLAMRTPEEIAYESWAGVSDDSGPETGTTTVGGTEYTTVSGSSGGDNGVTRSVSGSTRTDSRGNTTNFNVPSSSETYFAQGGRVGKAEGEMVGEERDEMGPMGFVNGRSPEEVTDADTVRDDVEGSVPEGTFVINAVAVEKYGSERIRKLLMSALQEAERQGIDISASGSTITDEDSVSVAVSEGEVLVPPVLVRIIGLQKLEKINSLGQEEVDERVEEYGQADTSTPVEGEAPVQASVGGGFVERQKKAKGDKVDPRRVLPVSNFKSYNTPDEGRNWMNFAENIGATLIGKRDAMAKAFSYARNYAINNEAEDEYEDTMRHALVGGLYAGGPDDNVLQKAGSAIASGFADYKERSAIQAENIEPILRLESAIDLNNNQYGRALRKAAGDEETFVRAVENLMDRLRRGEEAPRLKNEDGKEITLVLSTADGRAGGFVNRQRKAPGGKVEKYEPYKRGDKREGLFDYSLEMFRLKKRLGDNSANMPRKEAQEPNDPFGGQKQPYEFTGNMIVEFSNFLREELDFGNPDDRRTYLQLMDEALMYGSPQAVDQWYYSVEGHPLNDDMTDRNVDEQERVKKSSKNAKELYLAPSFLMT